MKKTIATLLCLISMVNVPIPANAQDVKSYEINKTSILLKSYLKENNKAYVYTIKNNTESPLVINEIKNIQNPHQVIIDKQKNRVGDIFENTGELIGAPFGIAIGSIGLLATTPGIGFYGTCYLISQDSIYLDSIPNTAGKSANLIKNQSYKLISIPYSALTLPIRDVIAIREASSLKAEKMPITIEPLKSVQVKALETNYRKKDLEFTIQEKTTI